MKRKLLSILLCLCLVCCLLPAGVLAAHQCVDTDGDYCCDYWIFHDCIDANGDFLCDLCGDWLMHDCEDEDRDGKLNVGDVAKIYSHIRGTNLLW